MSLSPDLLSHRSHAGDYAVRQQALNTRHSFIVQAPAGSGKTTLLVQRMLALLARVEKPEECLAITFTRKAAGEMRDRILSALALAQNEAPDRNSHEYQTWVLAKDLLRQNSTKGWNLAHNSSRLKIKTVDALCASLARQMPLLSQFGALPRVAEDPESLYREATRQLIVAMMTEESNNSLSLQNLLFHLDNNLYFAERLLSEFLGIREQWLPYINLANMGAEVRKLLEFGLQQAILKELHHCLKALPDDDFLLNELFELAMHAASNLVAEGSKSNIIHCSELSAWLALISQSKKDELSAKLELLPQWLGIAELLLTEQNEWRKTVTQQQGFQSPSQLKNKEEKNNAKIMKERMLQLLDALKDKDTFQESLARLRFSPPMHYSEEGWKVTEGIIQLLPRLASHLTLIFQQKGEVDFAEISMAAKRALQDNGDPTDLALALDYRLQHILVDEFQDISIPQKVLLEQLTSGWQPSDGRTLFLVGDPQQSIYRFRQAEVGLFLQAKQQGLGSISLIPLTLTVNFRSKQSIIDWVNNTFSKRFPKEDDLSLGSVAFSPSVGSDPLGSDPTDVLRSDPSVVIHTVDEESETEKLIACIEETRTLDPNGSIALLVRSRSHLNNVLTTLKKYDIPYQGVDIEPFIHHPLAQDLITFTKALLHLGDRLAWLSLLRLPNLALPLQDILLIATHEPQLPLWFTLKNYNHIRDLSLETRERLHFLVSCLEETFDKQGCYPLSVWVKDAWNAIHGDFDISQPAFTHEEQLIFSHYFTFLEEQGYSDEFYDVAELEKRCAAFYVPADNQSENALQIMTVHKAKGLEFDTVILLGLERSKKPETEKLLLWEQDLSLTGKPYLIFAPIRDRATQIDPIYRYLKMLNKKRTQAEEQRLMYVAATRAKKRLYLLSHSS